MKTCLQEKACGDLRIGDMIIRDDMIGKIAWIVTNVDRRPTSTDVTLVGPSGYVTYLTFWNQDTITGVFNDPT